MNHEDLIARPLNTNDLIQMMEIEEELFEPHKRFEAYVMYYYITRPKAFTLGLFTSKGELVAYIISEIRDEDVPIMHVVTVNVRKAYQRKGLGSLLMDKAIEYAKKNGIRFISLEVYTENKPAISLYLKKGFKVKKTLLDYYKEGEDAYFMVKEVY